MALPATGISLSAVNTELGNSGTAAITLNNARVRSLANTTGASGSSFSMSNLASKSGTWFLVLNVAGQSQTSDYTFTSTPDTLISQDSYLAPGRGRALNPDSSYGRYIIQVNKYSLNGQTIGIAAYDQTDAGTYGINNNGFNISKYTDNLLINWNYSATSGINYQGYSKISPAGTVLQHKYLANAYQIYNVLEAPSGNIYLHISWITVDGSNVVYEYVIALDSAGTFRWGRYWSGLTVDGGSSRFPTLRFIDSSENIYVSVIDTSTAGSRRESVVKFNSSGTTIAQTATFAFSGRTSFFSKHNHTTNRFTYAIANGGVAVFNGDLTFQWARTLQKPGLTGPIGSASIVSDNGEIYQFGTYGSLQGGDQTPSLFIVKYDSTGTIQWQRRITCTLNGTQKYAEIYGTPKLTGVNQGLLCMGLAFGDYDEYGFTGGDSVILSIKTDGSGIGTYSNGGPVNYIWTITADNMTVTTTAAPTTYANLPAASATQTFFNGVNNPVTLSQITITSTNIAPSYNYKVNI